MNLYFALLMEIGLSKSIETYVEIICDDFGNLEVWCMRPAGVRVRYTDNKRVKIGSWKVSDDWNNRSEWVVIELIREVVVDKIAMSLNWPCWQVNQVIKGENWKQVSSSSEIKWAKDGVKICIRGDKLAWGIGLREIGNRVMRGDGKIAFKL